MLKKIIIHWTAGNYKPNQTELLHYHFLIDDKGKIYKGFFKPEDNIDCKDSKYAAHTGSGNTCAIGVAFCGMFGFKNSSNQGNYPLKKVQCEAGFKFCATLQKTYNIDKKNILTHYEFGQQNPKTSSYGKIDIIYLPPYKDIPTHQIGDFIRNKITWYFEKL